MWISSPDPCLRIPGSTARAILWAPNRLMSKSFFQSSMVKVSCTPHTPMPALLTRTSSPPASLMAQAAPRATLWSSLTSISVTRAPQARSFSAADLLRP
ncbi:MAG: hypothetical protein A2X36_02795 [Elusimicrobia bacterium GWA2_69_24]|nr:MAG: hypothetical protein A2X36_02795 [Elusimicrobia bacterium GWA2_69_24]